MSVERRLALATSGYRGGVGGTGGTQNIIVIESLQADLNMIELTANLTTISFDVDITDDVVTATLQVEGAL